MKLFYFISFLLIYKISSAQNEDAWVYLSDKPEAEYYLNNPLEMLSQRALDRRIAQSISLDEYDVPVYVAYREQIQAVEGISVLAQSKWLNALHVRGSQENINSLSELPFVTSVYFANHSLNNISGRIARSEMILDSQKNLENLEFFEYGNSANQIEMLNGHLLHQSGFTGNGKIIAVIDNGFVGVDSTEPFQRLWENNLILGGYNFVQRNEDLFSVGTHGTMVLSTIGSYQENALIGTAPDASYYLFISESTTYESPLEESLWVEAAELADSLGVDVINTSLGYNTFDNPNYNYTYADMNGTTSFIARGADMAFSRGMICVTSAGNSGNSSWQYITTPADAVHTLTVGALQPNGNYATFSSIGPSADGRIKPDVVAQGAPSVIATTNGNISSANGTSFSSPITAGLVACLWQALPNATNAEIIQLVKESANLYENPTAQMGYGIPNFWLAYQTLKIENLQENDFLLYPNPTSDILYFYGNDAQGFSIKLFDISGKVILEKIIENNSNIDIQHLQDGVYFYQIFTDNQTKTGKIIKK